VDDSGSGGVARALGAEFPAVEWLIHERNQGFGATANDAVRSNPADIVILLNDDVELLANPVPPLRAAFERTAVFAITFRSVSEEGRFREGAKRIVWRVGYPRVLHNERDQRPPENGLIYSDYAVGGHAAFHRARFLELGGFDALFSPFYWEDVDLSVRAKKRGWACLYSPECIVRHAGLSSIRSSRDSAAIREITLRNRILFAWRHASRAQLRMLKCSLAWQRLAAALSGDEVVRRAYDAAEARMASYSSQTHFPTEQPTGVTLGDS
jgi:GT2 family glycosyltransferase